MRWSGSKLFTALLAFVLLWGGVVYYYSHSLGVSAETIYEPPKLAPRSAIVVTDPAPYTLVESPLAITGKAKGNWYFEASFPVALKDATGKVLGQAPAQAQGDWMTTDYVPFSLNLNFDDPMTAMGTLVFSKDNPSGLPQYGASFSIPVRFR